MEKSLTGDAAFQVEADAQIGPETRNSLYFSQLSGNFELGEQFASDCGIRQAVCDFCVLCRKLENSAHMSGFSLTQVGVANQPIRAVD
jgi:hypothetical protein